MDSNLVTQAVLAALESLGISKESMTGDPNMPQGGADMTTEGLPGQGNRLLTWDTLDVTVPKDQKPAMWDTSSLFMQKQPKPEQDMLGIGLQVPEDQEMGMVSMGVV